MNQLQKIETAGRQSIHETSVAAVAAQAKAAVEARFLVAINRPRDMDDVRVRLIKECSRPGFAQVARYRKPIGKGIVGPSIRFAEAAIRLMGNIDVQTPSVYEDEHKRIIRVTVTDLENNATFSTDVTVDKTVERRDLRDGQVPLSARENSTGQMVYLVAATEDDLANKTNALISKAMRNAALRLLPGDILEECMERVVQTQRKRDAEDPDAAQKKLADAFAQIGVSPKALATYLGHEIAQCSPSELSDLRATYAAIRDGETTWAAVMEAVGDEDKPKGSPKGRQAAKEKVRSMAKPKDEAEQKPMQYGPDDQ